MNFNSKLPHADLEQFDSFKKFVLQDANLNRTQFTDAAKCIDSFADDIFYSTNSQNNSISAVRKREKDLTGTELSTYTCLENSDEFFTLLISLLPF